MSKKYKPLDGSISRKTMSKSNNSIRCAARYLLLAEKKCLASECYVNMRFKSGKLYRTSGQSTSLRKLEARMGRHPALTQHKQEKGAPLYTCTLEAYEDYFLDDPYYDWTDNAAINRRPRNG